MNSLRRSSWFWKCFASRACLIKCKSTALSSIFVEMNPSPKSIMKIFWEGKFGEPLVLVFWMPPPGADNIVFDVVRSLWMMLFSCRRATCSPICCMTLNCFFSG